MQEFKLTANRWGTLTGVRPIRLAHQELVRGLSDEDATRILTIRHGVTSEIAARMVQIARAELPFLQENPKRACLYLSIPFCPSRCLYCSFPVETVRRKGKLIPTYLELLLNEVDVSLSLAKKNGLIVDCIYIGGGTPSVLTLEQTETLLSGVDAALRRYGHGAILEYTFEAGRVETIDEEKMRLWKDYGIDRISLNPQSFASEVQVAVGRPLSNAHWELCFDAARRVGFRTVNSDLIVGLPGETVDSFVSGVEQLIALRPENITIHALALKRGSRLNEQLVRQHDAHRKGKRGSAAKLEWLPEQGEETMFDRSEALLMREGYSPYYLYRQMNIKGGLHNVGYALPGHESRYNIRMIEESHSILACGVGAVSKGKVDHGSFCIDERRIANFNSIEEYIARFDELIERKIDAFRTSMGETN